MHEEAFLSEPYTEIQLTLTETAPIYSEEYEALVEEHESELSQLCGKLAEQRYNDLLAQFGLPAEMAEQAGLSRPETYVLTRRKTPVMSALKTTPPSSAASPIFSPFSSS